MSKKSRGASGPRRKVPIMPLEYERFLAFLGLLHWNQAVILQGARIQSAIDEVSKFMMSKDYLTSDRAAERLLLGKLHTDEHLFAVAAHKLIEHRRWVAGHGLCADIDFSEIDAFSADDIKDLRDMREHIRDYFTGYGRNIGRWRVNNSDASSTAGTLIGGRLDWKAFAAAAERLLPKLNAQPMPYPTQSVALSTYKPDSEK